MRYIVALILVLAGFVGLGLVLRLPAEEKIPKAPPPPPPSVEEVQEAANSFRYQRGVYGGRLKVQMSDDPQTFNTVLSKDAVTTNLLSWLYEGILDRDRVTYELEPRLAEKMPEQIDEEGLVWEVTLRKDVTWFDGESLTADDVVFTMNDIVYNNVIPTSARFSWLLDDVDPETGKKVTRQVKVEKTGEYTIRYTLPFPWAYFQTTLTQAIYPEHILGPAVRNGRFNNMWNLDTDPREVIGCGMFKLHSYRDGERVILRRNKDYFRKNRFGDRIPYIDELVYLIVKQGDTARDMFKEGQFDILGVGGADFKAMYHQQRVKDFTIYRRGPSTGTRFLVFNQNPRSGPNGPYVKPHKLAWFRDRRFRRAIAHAIDRKAIAEIVFKRQAYIQDSPVSKANTRFYTGEPETFDERFEEEVLEKVGDKLKKFPVVTYAYDLDKANAYLDDMGLTERNEEGYRIDDEGRVVEFVINTYTDSPDYARIISIMKTEFKRVGVKANMVQLTFSGLVSKLMREHNWEAIIIGLTGGYGDPMNSGRNVWPSSGNLHMWNPQQKTEEHAYPWELRINEIFSQAQRTPDYAERLALAAEFQHIVSREAPLIYTVNEAMNTAVYNRFGNFNPTVYSLIDYSMIYDRELKKKRQREK